jgi:ankyrin repeat protein
VNPSADNNYAIRGASANGRVEVVKELLKHKGVDPSADDNDAIRKASANGHVEVVKELLKDPRVNPSADNNYAIRMAIENGHVEVMKELLKDSRVEFSLDYDYALPLVYQYVCRKKALLQNCEKGVARTIAALFLVLRNEAKNLGEKIATRIVAGLGISFAMLINIVEIMARLVLSLCILPFSKGSSFFFLRTATYALASVPIFFKLFAKNIYKDEQITQKELWPLDSRN